MHNVLNATAAIAVGVGLDVGVDAIRTALDQFRGVDRRFQLRGRAAGISVIDDYGHHPTEIKATLAAARQCGFRKVHVIFQPHRYTRTRDLMEEFTTAFGDADSLFVVDIYAASEKPIEGITGEILAQRIREKSGKSVAYCEFVRRCREFRRGRRARRRHDPDAGSGQRFAAGADDSGEAEGAEVVSDHAKAARHTLSWICDQGAVVEAPVSRNRITSETELKRSRARDLPSGDQRKSWIFSGSLK